MIKGAIVFLLIVWAVAASMLGAEQIAVRVITDVGPRYPQFFGRVLLPRSTQASLSCRVPLVETQAPIAVEGQATRLWVWTLGLALGRLAWLTQQVHSPVVQQSIDQSALAIRTLSRSLQVPVPSPFVNLQPAWAHREFADFVESDEIPTAHAVALGYSSASCHLYKLGVRWGYWVWVRARAPGQSNLFSPQLNFHARRAGLPQPLWMPMIESTPDGASQQIGEQGAAAADAVRRYLSTQP